MLLHRQNLQFEQRRLLVVVGRQNMMGPLHFVPKMRGLFDSDFMPLVLVPMRHTQPLLLQRQFFFRGSTEHIAETLQVLGADEALPRFPAQHRLTVEPQLRREVSLSHAAAQPHHPEQIADARSRKVFPVVCRSLRLGQTLSARRVQ